MSARNTYKIAVVIEAEVGVLGVAYHSTEAEAEKMVRHCVDTLKYVEIEGAGPGADEAVEDGFEGDIRWLRTGREGW